MKIVIINKSDSTGGAAVVSRRLMEAFVAMGVDARMLVVEKLTDSPRVEVAASDTSIKWNFLKERLGVFVRNGFSRKTLFQVDPASDGLPLWRHPLVMEADAVLLNWVNQGMLSLKGVRKILDMGKPVVWTMHDMWNMTGICHHAGACREYMESCGKCPFLGPFGRRHDVSYSTWKRKMELYFGGGKLAFVAVSNWLAYKALEESSLLFRQRVEVIPNVFPLAPSSRNGRLREGKIRILFGAARIDDPVKGLPALVEMTRALRASYPGLAERMELVTFGGVKDPSSLDGMAIPHRHLGRVNGEEAVRRLYEESDILVSASSYETLPGTLVEAQAYGCIPVSFNQGGQSDIMDHLQTGYLAEWSGDAVEGGRRLAEGVAWAAEVLNDSDRHLRMIEKMRDNVGARFSVDAVAGAYLSLISDLQRPDI